MHSKATGCVGKLYKKKKRNFNFPARHKFSLKALDLSQNGTAYKENTTIMGNFSKTKAVVLSQQANDQETLCRKKIFFFFFDE
jgi:hypothetical protein